LNGAKLRVVTNMRHFDSTTVNQVNQPLSRLDSVWSAVQRDCHILSALRDCLWMVPRRVWMRKVFMRPLVAVFPDPRSLRMNKSRAVQG
jgi:hypothetical protein